MTNEYLNRRLSVIIAPIVARNGALAKHAGSWPAEPKRIYNNLPAFGAGADGIVFVGKQDCD